MNTDLLINKCNSLIELNFLLNCFEGPEIKKAANNTVFSEGSDNAPIMIIGEAPGAQEDLEGRPFCGRSGKLLDRMLASVNLSRERDVYISNSVFWRPPGNRKPTEAEIQACRPFTLKHISLKAPKVLFLLGATAQFAVLDLAQPISKVRGQSLIFTDQHSGNKIPTVVSFHPSYLLRQPEKKREAYEDLKLLNSMLCLCSPDK